MSLDAARMASTLVPLVPVASVLEFSLLMTRHLQMKNFLPRMVAENLEIRTSVSS